jgi:hypothetical protein
MGKESQRNGPYGVPQGKACAGPIPPGERSASGVAASVSEWNPEQPPIKVQNVTGGNGANGAGVFTAKHAKEREDKFLTADVADDRRYQTGKIRAIRYLDSPRTNIRYPTDRSCHRGHRVKTGVHRVRLWNLVPKRLDLPAGWRPQLRLIRCKALCPPAGLSDLCVRSRFPGSSALSA